MDNATADGLSVRLDLLQLEQEFALPIPIGDICRLKWGRLLHVGVGSSLVQFVEDERVVEVRIASDTLVIPDEIEEKKESQMSTQAVNQTASSIMARYKFQLNALASEDTSKQNTAIERLPKILSEAVAAGVVLPAPETLHPSLEGHPAFEGIEFGAPLAVVEASTPAQAGEAKAAARTKAVKAAKAATPKAEKKPREKKVKTKKQCLDGCGGETFGNFRPGHDAKLKSIILRIERGDEPMSELPEVARAHVEFKKGDLVTEKDAKGKVTSKVQTYVCTKSPVKLPGR